MTARYSFGWSDPRAMYGSFGNVAFKLYGKDYKKVSSVKAIFNAVTAKSLDDVFNTVYKIWNKRFDNNMKVDAHKYETEAKDLDIQVIHDLWQVKYGNEKITAEVLANQDPFTWECGNRLYWAGYLSHSSAPDLSNDSYTLLDEPNHANHR